MKEKCTNDYKGQHYWVFKGIRVLTDGKVFEIYKCSQCSFFIAEEGKWIDEAKP